MKKLIAFLIFLILIPSAFADWFYNSQHIITKITINGDAEVVYLAPNGYIEKATINLTFFPKEAENQQLLEFDTNPEADVSEKTAKFEWRRPSDKIEFRVVSTVKTSNSINQIRKKIDFPINDLPDNVIIYTKPSMTIDSDDEDIIRLASELVKGEDDLYAAVFKIAEWTKNNIKYDLSTLTAEVSQKASWVLQNRQGVCDELTSLFIAMLRTVGIPARFVSGIAYTNSELFPERWGAHGWAEVYFPDYGWVPFDVTYGQYGWIDPTHVKFKDSVDSDEPSTYYYWLGRNADLKTKKLDVKTELIDSIGYSKPQIKLTAVVLKKSISFGSYNLVEAEIENLDEFYYATELYISKPREVKIIGNDFNSVLLLPKEKKKAYWIVKVDSDLDSRYSYTMPLSISTTNNVTSETSFVSSIREGKVLLEEVQQAAKLLEEEIEKKYSGNVFLDCNPSKNEFYEYEQAEVYCLAKNTGNVFLDDVNICFQNNCEKTNLGISQAKNFTFEIEKSKIGLLEIPVTLSSNIVSKSNYVSLKINDIPKILIEDLQHPINVSYDTNLTIFFKIAKKSQSNPKNVKITFRQNDLNKEWFINELSEDRKFVLNIEGSQLRYGKNNYEIDAFYADGLNKQYSTKQEFSIELVKANPLQRISLALNNLEGISNQTIIIMLLAGTIAFILVLLWLFRRGRKI